MAVAPDSQRRRLPGLELLQPPQRRPLEQLKSCLGSLQRGWRRDNHFAALWQDWPVIVGKRLAPHCRPLELRRGTLTIGASHPQWRQALLYNRPQLLNALASAGYSIRNLRVQQHHAVEFAQTEDEATIWARHPSRIDIHGMGTCPSCNRLASKGEIKLWDHCGFCHRQHLIQSTKE
ncbi:DUF721 domain-containing protein [Synechococcus sp. M16CYN]|uniref:DUF721 domain-containing protein n=1 Tax=Synechococcus sp. M16CYN TaxID=3103139 RepID=UPI0032468E75